jgi:plasmid stabilization system protein ParE
VTPSSYRVEEKLEVLQDYVAIARHIERWTEHRALADRTVDTIRSFIRSLAEYPHRGKRRDDLRENLRIVPFKRRTAIAIEIDDDARMVTVLRVFYGGQDYEAVMRDQLDRTDEEG